MPPELNKHGCAMSTGMVCVTCGEVNPDECLVAGVAPPKETDPQTLTQAWTDLPP